mgnify:CR=1 FL=1
MEKKQYDLCLEILKRFKRAGILDNFILIGSWCTYFYKDYFPNASYVDYAGMKTRDIDFLVDNPSKVKNKADIPHLLEDLGFVIDLKGDQGYIQLDHPDLILEFLVQEKGKGTDKPYSLPSLGVNATPLRFLNLLSPNTIKVKIENFYLTLPHPANFALHKLIISQRRLKGEKALKDKNTAILILKALISKGESHIIKRVFDHLFIKKLQNKIISILEETREEAILEALQSVK